MEINEKQISFIWNVTEFPRSYGNVDKNNKKSLELNKFGSLYSAA